MKAQGTCVGTRSLEFETRGCVETQVPGVHPLGGSPSVGLPYRPNIQA